MKLTVTPGHPLQGEVTLPGDKSLSHRAALFAALAEGTSQINHFLVSGVTRPLLAALTALGVEWELNGEELTIEGRGWQRLQPPNGPLNCGNSATTLRLLAGALAASGVPALLDGSAGLRSRPMNRITLPLREMGVDISAEAGECAPLRLAQRSLELPLLAIDYNLPVASAQVKSCLLLAALSAGGPVILHEPGPSRDHTERMLSSMGVKIYQQDHTVTLEPPKQPLTPLRFSPPGDFSSAAFVIVATLITPGSKVILHDVGLNPTRTGLLDALQAMGADIQIQPKGERSGEQVGDLIVSHSDLHGTQVSGDLVVRMIDEFPAFAAAASFAGSDTTVRDAEELRHKESDRIGILCQELAMLGISTDEAADGFTIHAKGSVVGGTVDPHRDHRMAMALALTGLASRKPVTVHHAQILAESFPEFVTVLSGLGAHIDQEDEDE